MQIEHSLPCPQDRGQTQIGLGTEGRSAAIPSASIRITPCPNTITLLLLLSVCNIDPVFLDAMLYVLQLQSGQSAYCLHLRFLSEF